MERDIDTTSFNPWAREDSSVASLRNALLLAERTGHVYKLEQYDSSKLSDMTSTKLIKLQKEISQKKIELNKVNLEIQKLMQDHETKDILHVEVIEKRREMLKDLTDHLQSVVSNKEMLITRLQQPFVGDYIKLEANYHRYASEVFTQLAPILSGLSMHLDDLTWIKDQDFSDGFLDNLLSEVSAALATLQTGFQSVTQMSKSIEYLQQNNVSHNS